MRIQTTIVSSVLTLALSASCFANPTTGDAQGVEKANAQFYASLNAMFRGEIAPMEQVWSHATDVTYMGPAGGIQTGWDHVRSAWESQAALKLGGKVEPTKTRIIVGDDLATVTCLEVGDNRDAQGRPQNVSIRATNVFRKENGQWKMIGHHTDLLPFLEDDAQTLTAK